MIVNLKIDLNDASFEFLSVNRVRLQLYQVYVLHAGRQARFHMQVDDEGGFRIADRQACPEPYLGLESTFSDAIVKLGEIK